MAIKIEWACPKCGAVANAHGKGGSNKCEDRLSRNGEDCSGFICECDGDEGGIDIATEGGHGECFSNPCPTATCYHCGWGGTFPKRPKGLQPWERKALEAGWAPPEKRKKELGI